MCVISFADSCSVETHRIRLLGDLRDRGERERLFKNKNSLYSCEFYRLLLKKKKRYKHYAVRDF